MRALRFHGTHDVRLEDVATPVAGPGEIVVRPEAVGLCGTDLHIFHGEFPAAAPVVLGHEVAARVETIGTGADGVREGDLVTIEPHRYCGACRYCRLGRQHLCLRKQAFGVHLDGGLAEAMVVPAEIAYPLPPGLPAEIGCLAEPVACCVHGMDRLEPVSGLPVLIFGAGAAGCVLARLAALAGLTPVVTVEPLAARRAAALKLGATHTLDPQAEGWEERALELTGGAGYDFAIDAVGLPAALEAAIRLSARGARILQFGVARPDAVARVHPQEIFAKELTIAGTVINPYTHERAVELLPRLGLEQLRFARFGLDGFADALEAQAGGAVEKVVITPQAAPPSGASTP